MDARYPAGQSQVGGVKVREVAGMRLTAATAAGTVQPAERRLTAGGARGVPLVLRQRGPPTDAAALPPVVDISDGTDTALCRSGQCDIGTGFRVTHRARPLDELDRAELARGE
jgi:hypothetical protein